ncbi:ankyrin repeat-containing domain protein [Aspergillus pseudodeflectus]|uniref:Ankyrin repeat-containing domain protein n=1 Tax=Aspergillus pseudodeflectus TaxID=176178 RepID=A0ABR4KXJ1_9EURO
MIKLSRMSKKQRKRLADLSTSLPPELILRLGAFLDQKTLCSCVRVSRRYNILLTPLLYDNAIIYKDIWVKRETSEELEYRYPEVPIPKPGRGYADYVFNTKSLAQWSSPVLLEYWSTKPLEMIMYPSLEYTEMGDIGWTILHAAAKVGNAAIVSMLLDRGVGVGTETFRGETALHFACTGRQLGMIKLLLARGANPLVHADDGRALLYHAMPAGEQVFLLIYAAFRAGGGDVSSRGSRAQTYLQLAWKSMKRDVVDMLLADGADPSVEDSDGLDFLHYIGAGPEDLIKTVIRDLDERGVVNFDKPNRENARPLHAAIIRDRLEIVHMLIERGADILSRQFRGLNALELAVDSGSRSCIWMFLETHPHIRVEDHRLSDADAEMIASVEYHLDEVTRSYGVLDIQTLVLVARLRTTQKLNVDRRNLSHKAALILDQIFKHGQNALHPALPVIRAVLDAGIDVDIRVYPKYYTRLETFLIATVPARSHPGAYYEVLQMLLDASRAASTVHEESGNTILHVAVTKGDPKIIQMILTKLDGDGESKAVHTKNKQGYPPLLCTIGSRNSEPILQALIAAGASVTDTSKDGRSALHLAASIGDQLGAVALLISKRADVNALCASGYPAVHYAAVAGWDEAVGVLVAAGARAHRGCLDCEARMKPWLVKEARETVLRELTGDGRDGEYSPGLLSVFS